MTTTRTTIEVRGLTKSFRVFRRRAGILGGIRDLLHRRYQDFKAVNSISFDVRPGERVGLIGPNGAGKSTTVKMLTGILVPTSGEIHVAGYIPHRNRIACVKNIGAVFGQRTQLWWDLAVIESFTLLGKIYGVPDSTLRSRIDRLNTILDITRLLRTPVRKLSLGQRMRCDLAASLLHAPGLLFLDEPTIGLDIVAKDRVRAFLNEINQEFQTTIFITTHDLRDIEELCERILIIDQGQLLFDGPLGEVKAVHTGETHFYVDLATAPPAGILEGLGGEDVHWEQVSPLRFQATFDRHRVRPADLVRALFSKIEVTDIEIPGPSIETVIKRIYQEGRVTMQPPAEGPLP